MNNLINLTQQSNLVLTFLQTFHVFKIGHKKVKGKNLSHEIISYVRSINKIQLTLSQLQPWIYEYRNLYHIAGIKSKNYKEVTLLV